MHSIQSFIATPSFVYCAFVVAVAILVQCLKAGADRYGLRDHKFIDPTIPFWSFAISVPLGMASPSSFGFEIFIGEGAEITMPAAFLYAVVAGALAKITFELLDAIVVLVWGADSRLHKMLHQYTEVDSHDQVGDG